MQSEGGPRKGRCSRGPHHGGPGPAPPASAFRLSSPPLPPLALCRLHRRKHGQRRLPATPLTAKFALVFRPSETEKRATGPVLSGAPPWTSRPGLRAESRRAGAPAALSKLRAGRQGFRERGPRLPGKGTRASGKGGGASGKGGQDFRERDRGLRKRGPRLPGKGAGAHFSCHPGQDGAQHHGLGAPLSGGGKLLHLP